MEKSLQLTQRCGRIEIALDAYFVGADLQLVIAGGDRPHIGAVAVGFCGSGCEDLDGTDVTTSLMTVPGHKEDQLARDAAYQVAAATGRTVCVSCGIHLERISKAEIRGVEKLVRDLVEALLSRLGRSE